LFVRLTIFVREPVVVKRKWEEAAIELWTRLANL
jgi:hypothetical protein